MPRVSTCIALAALGAAVVSGCDRHRGPPPPSVDFLAAAGDSTFWVRTGPRGLTNRGSAILLARVDGRFYEIYVADDDRSYHDAILVGHRLFRRDLVTGDSLLLFQDSLIPAIARVYAEANPDEEPLGPEDIASANPGTIATAELMVLDVHGPFLSYEYHADLETIEGEETHSTRRGVVDLRDGGVAMLATIFDPGEAARLQSEGEQRFTEALDSLRHLRGRAAADAALDLARLRFDPKSFVIDRVGSAPGVAFHVPGSGPEAEGMGLDLPVIPAAPPSWWAAALETLADSLTADLERESWARQSYVVLAHYGAVGDTAQLVVRDSAGGDWLVGRVPAPVHRIHWLDDPPIDSLARRALLRAFDEAAMYSEGVQLAASGRMTDMQLAGSCRMTRRDIVRHARSPRARKNGAGNFTFTATAP